MAKKKITFDPNASYMEESAQPVYDADLSQVEYDPMIDDGDMPYISQGRGGRNPYANPNQQQYRPINQGFVDVNNIQNFSNQHQNPQQHFQQQMYEATQEPGIDYRTAGKNVELMSGALDAFNSVDRSTSAGSDNEVYAIGVAIKSIQDAIKVLRDVEYWIPSTHERLAPQLKKVGTPIVKAVAAYAEKIEQLK